MKWLSFWPGNMITIAWVVSTNWGGLTRNMVLPPKPLEEFYVSRGRRCQSICLINSRILCAVGTHSLRDMHTTRRLLSQTMGQRRWLARHNLETNPITIKLEVASHVAEQCSWVALPCCFTWVPSSSSKACLPNVCSPGTIRFWKRSPSCDTGTIRERKEVLVLAINELLACLISFLRNRIKVFSDVSPGRREVYLWSPHKRCSWVHLFFPNLCSQHQNFRKLCKLYSPLSAVCYRCWHRTSRTLQLPSSLGQGSL